MLRLTIPGAPRTKKNHGQIVRANGRKPSMLPSKQWRAWSDAVSPRIRSALATAGMAPISYPVNCRAIFYRDANRGDAVGYYQGLADVLEKAGVVTNDVCITTWDGSRLRNDAANPRVEIELTRAED